MTGWTLDEKSMVKFRVLMETLEQPLNEWLSTMVNYFDDSPNSILIRILGYAVSFYNKALNDGASSVEAYHQMMQEISKLPIAQQLFVMAGGDMMNKMAGVE